MAAAASVHGFTEPVPSPSHASYSCHAGNVVVPLVDGHAAFTRVCEAILAARHSVWVVLGFLDVNTRLPYPDGRSLTLFEVLGEAKLRGVDVRVLFWGASTAHFGGVFAGTDEDRALLRKIGAKFVARWDASGSKHPRHCHHEKSWLIDVGTASEVVFTGGMGVNPGTVSATPEHLIAPKSYHDAIVELVGPSATDLHHSFVQRWNQAMGADTDRGCWPSARAATALPFPSRRSPPRDGASAHVQVLRSVQAGRYSDTTPAPGNSPFPIAAGEASILEAYKAAFAAAREYIYCENQHLAHPELINAMAAAAKRGVEVVYVAPRNAMSAVRACAAKAASWVDSGATGDAPPYAGVFVDNVPRLAREPKFTLLGLAVHPGPASPGKRGGTAAGSGAGAGAGAGASGDTPASAQGSGAVAPRLEFVYVHAKVAIVDDVWLTVGSANLVDISFEKDHTEVNVAVWDKAVARQLRVQLVQEHSGVDTGALSGAEAMRTLVTAAEGNKAALASSGLVSEDGLWRATKPPTAKLSCHAFVMDPLTYGL